MKQFKYVIKDQFGMHARPAGLFVKEAAAFSCNIKLAANGKEVDAKRIMGVMSLGVKCGNEVTVTADGADEAAAAEKLESFLKANV